MPSLDLPDCVNARDLGGTPLCGLLEHFDGEHGGVPAYLTGAGVADHHLAAVKARLTVES